MIPDFTFGSKLQGSASKVTVLSALKDTTRLLLQVLNDRISTGLLMYQTTRWLLASRQDSAIESARPFLLELAQNPRLIRLQETAARQD